MKKKKENKKQNSSIKNGTVKIPVLTKGDNFFGIFIILLFTFIAYLPVLKAGFVNWDDPQYVYENTLLTSFSHLKEILTTPVQGNLHPLTMLSLAFNYSISGQNAWSYHLLNLLFHLANTILVYILARRLSKENEIISITTALLFALHPMHVESVAWVSERKDVLYSFFYLLGLISYTKYSDTNKRIPYLLSLIWLVLSLASKPAAVIFPVALFTIDLLRKRKFNLLLITEKIPFFVVSAVLGYLTLHIQSTEGATQGQNYFGFNDRFFFGFYGFLMYISKLIFPVNLVPFYPFPAVKESLPFLYYLSPVFFIAICFLCIKTIKNSIVFAFGFSFYFLNLILVLQFFIVGSAIIADRYTYIPYIGIFYIIGWLIDKWQGKSLKKAFVCIVIPGIILSTLTYNQAQTWKNSSTLWDHAINVHPSFRAYNNRGLVYQVEGNNEKALEYYNKIIKMTPNYAEVYINRGILFANEKKFAESLKDYNHALNLQPGNFLIYYNRGNLMGNMQKYEEAIKDFSQAITLKNDYGPAYFGRGLAENFSGAKDLCCSDLQRASSLKFKPANDALLSLCH